MNYPKCINKKLNIILDLDQTLIAGELLSEMNKIRSATDREQLQKQLIEYGKKYGRHEFHSPDGEVYVIYGRPFLQEFLDVLFANFNVSVWTAASSDYAQFVINNFILLSNTNRKLDFIYTRNKCEIYSDKNSQFLTKPLIKLFKQNECYKPRNTFILDDNDDVHKIQPYNCIKAIPFNIINKDKNMRYIKDSNGEYFNRSGENDYFLSNIASKLYALSKLI